MHQLDVTTAFLSLSESLTVDRAAFEAVLHPEVEQIEYPNSLSKTLQRRSFSEILENLRAGRELLVDPHFELQRAAACSDESVTVEAHWHATIATDFGPLLRGQRLAAQACMVFEFKDGRIFRHRAYYSFEPF